MPEAYDSVGVVEKSEEEDDEYDVMIRLVSSAPPWEDGLTVTVTLYVVSPSN